MNDLAIRVDNLSKRYKIGARRNRHDTLRDHLMHGVKSLFSRNGRWDSQSAEGHGPGASQSFNSDYIWALKDVSFEIKHGEVVGFIGKNGAGKSTLLKILSRITEPSNGRAEIFGRVGSLLEVGTGFHGELTGRENIYLSGAILGMKKKEIEGKFDEIVAFSEIEKFIDTPVKRYSSGMYVRLAFSVAAHLDPDILVIDEVLAVGDAAFRLKCLNKMQAIREQGHTILFVSHNMDALTRMCGRVFLLESGCLVQSGSAQEIVSRYLASMQDVSAEKTWDDPNKAPGNEKVRLQRVRVRTENGETVYAHDIRLPVGIEVEYEVLAPGNILIPNYHFNNEEGLPIFVVQDVFSEWRRRPRPAGRYTSTAWIPGNFLAEGRLTVTIGISSHVPANEVHVWQPHVVGFQVIDSQDGNSARGDFKGPIPGFVRPVVRWSTFLGNSN